MNDRGPLVQQYLPKPPGRSRQWFLRAVAWFGLAVYVPAFLIVLLWPGLVVAGAKMLIIQEVNERFEKLGGLKSTLSGKVDSLREKFAVLDHQQSREEKDMLELGAFVDENAERIITGFVEERTSELDGTNKLRLTETGLKKLTSEEKNSQEEITPISAITDASTGTDAMSDETSGTVFSKLKHRFENRIATSGKSEGEVSSSPLENIILKFTAGSNSLLTRAVERGSIEIVRMKNALTKQYDETVQALVRELRIFTGSNIIIFGLLWLASLNPGLARHLFPVSIILLACTLGISYFYLVESNWILSILHRSYLGWGYIVAVFGVTLYIIGEGLIGWEFTTNNSDE